MLKVLVATCMLLLSGAVSSFAGTFATLNEAIATAAALEAGSNYWLGIGEPEKALKQVRTLVQILQIAAIKDGELATELVHSGRFKTNQPYWYGPATPAQLLGIALGLEHPTAYWDELVRQARIPPSSAPEGDLHTFCMDMGRGARSCTTSRY